MALRIPRLRKLALWGGLAIGMASAFAVTTLVFPNTGLAQELNFNLGEGGSMTGSLLRMVALLTILSLVRG